MFDYMCTWLYVNLHRFDNEEGQGMAEYGLLLALIAVVVIVAATLLGGNIAIKFDEIADELVAPVP